MGLGRGCWGEGGIEQLSPGLHPSLQWLLEPSSPLASPVVLVPRMSAISFQQLSIVTFPFILHLSLGFLFYFIC